MDGREALYLRPGMNDAELFTAFGARNPYYRYIAERLVAHVRRFQGPNFGVVLDILARTGYCTRAVGETRRTIAVEHRPPFVEYLKNEFFADRHVQVLAEHPLDAALHVEVDTILCCEQISILHADYAELVKRLARDGGRVLFAFAFTLGPSHHSFATLRVSNFRSGVVNEGETMTELSHPIQQAVHSEVFRIVRERHAFDREAAWPPEAKRFDLSTIRAANGNAGLRELAVMEEAFPVAGHQIHLYSQNGWTMFFRFPPLSELPGDTKIAILTEAVENVRAMPEYDEWCGITAYHPVAYVVAA